MVSNGSWREDAKAARERCAGEGTPTWMKRTLALALGLAAAVMVVACYRLVSTTTVVSSAPTWSGTGTRSTGGVTRSLGLAGQDVHWFTETGSGVLIAPFLAQFGGPHRLTSYVPTAVLSHHEREFIHGNMTGRTDNLRLLYKDHPDNQATWVQPAGPTFWDGGEYLDVIEICGLAASEPIAFVHPYEPDSHLFMSFRACGRSSLTCAGGVLEAEFDQQITRWWVRSHAEGVQVTVRKPDGNRFSNECMPISVTSDRAQARQYLVVGDPSWDEISVFDALRLWSGPIESWRAPESNRAIRDLVIEGRRERTYDLAFVAVLWAGTAGTQLRHYSLADGVVNETPFLSETLPTDVQLIESNGPRMLWDTGHLYTYGAQVVRRQYAR